MLDNIKVSVLIPCYNEEVTIGKVVRDFKTSIPSADIYVYDNNSTDKSVEVALSEGAIVRKENRQGKGFVIRRMFADIDSDFYILIDGDATYDAAASPMLLQHAYANGLDMINASRTTSVKEAYRPGHVLGNKILTGLVNAIFGRNFSDMLSGYRVFSKRFVKSFPVLSKGFEVETEITIHALELKVPADEIATAYTERPPGSLSKLKTYYDGFRILITIFNIFKLEKPFLLFSSISLLFFILGLGLGIPVISVWIKTGLVPRLPTALLSTGLIISSFLCFSCGLVLDTISLARKEKKLLAYLSYPAPPSPQQDDHRT